MKKKFLSIILTLAMVVTMIPMFGVTASATDNWNSGGDGSATNPYIISNYDQLNKFAEGVNAGTITTESKYFKLAKDFGKGASSDAALSKPIGNDSEAFAGTFDGNGQTVKLNISTEENFSHAGMFGYMQSGYVKNVSTYGVASSKNEANAAAGGVVGFMYGGKIINCSSLCGVEAESLASAAGGVVGYNDNGTVINCYAIGEVAVNNGSAGGVVGYNDSGTVTKCYSTEDSLFGVGSGEACYQIDDDMKVGEENAKKHLAIALNEYAMSNDGKAEACMTWNTHYYVNAIYCNGSPYFANVDTSWYNENGKFFIINNTADLEGLACLVNTGIDSFEGKTIKLAERFDSSAALVTPIGYGSNSFKGIFDGNEQTVRLGIEMIKYTSEPLYNGGLFGYINNAIVRNVTTIGSVKGEIIIGGIVGYNDGGLVENCCAKVVISGIVGIGGIVGENKNGTVQNCSSSAEITGQDGDGGIGGIVGTNMFYSDENTLGCVKIINCHSMGKVSGWGYIGGIVGQNRGEDSGFGGDSIDGVIEIKGCSSNGMVIGGIRAGGIVGGNNSDEETIIEGCYATGDVSGNNEIGGIAGAVSGNIINCFVTGNVSANSGEGAYNVGGICGSGKATNCYMAGTVTATATGEGSSVFNIGGICGGGTATNCYMAGTVAAKAEGEDSSESFIGGVCGSGTATNCYYKASNSYKGICVGEEGTPTDAAGNTTPLYPSQMTAKSGETNYNWAAIKVGDEALGKVALVDALNKYAISAAGKEKGCKAWTQSVFVNKGYPAFGAEKKSGIMQLVIKGIAAITGLKLVKSVVLSPVLLKVLKWSTVLKIFK